MQYSKEALENEFKKNHLVIEEVAEGEVLNSDHSKYNFLYLLKKGQLRLKFIKMKLPIAPKYSAPLLTMNCLN
jgi:hypothetical protein